MRILVLCSLLAATLTLAQTTNTLTLRVGSDGADAYTMTASECSKKLLVRWKYLSSQGISILCTPLTLWSTASECNEKPGDSDVRYDDIPAQTLQTIREGTFEVTISELPDFAKKDTTTPCGSTNINKTHKVCGVIEYAQLTCGMSNQPKLRASPLTIHYDTKPPAAPKVKEIKAFDSQVEVSFEVDSETSTVFAEFRKQHSGDFLRSDEIEASAGSMKLKDLENNVTYDVRLLAKDAVGNTSEASDIVSVTPLTTVGFWGAYRSHGGMDPAGCSSAPGFFLPVLQFVYLRRRRRFERTRPTA